MDDIINKIDDIFPEDYISLPKILDEYPNLKEHLEDILKIIQKRNTSISKERLLRKHLIRIYLYYLDYQNSKKMVEWLEERDLTDDFISNKIALTEIKSLAWYYFDVGIHYEFSDANPEKAKKYFNKALELTSLCNKEEVDILKYNIYAALAQTQIFEGDIDRANSNMERASLLLKDINQKKDIDVGIYHFIKARIYSELGEYQKANIEINKCIEFDAKLPLDYFTTPTVVEQAEILNLLGKNDEAYKVMNNVFDKFLNSLDGDHDLKARALSALSRAEMHLGKKEESLNHIKESIAMLMRLDRNKVDIEQIIDPDLADALVVQADIEFSNNASSGLKVKNIKGLGKF